jgi:hypothetical protein
MNRPEIGSRLSKKWKFTIFVEKPVKKLLELKAKYIEFHIDITTCTQNGHKKY